MLTKFIQEGNIQQKYNINGCINAIPIIVTMTSEKIITLLICQKKSFTDKDYFQIK
jgi:hypothetical protein